jgi:threonine dehydrogenase-like Zn-dependent dehydrogenase
MTTVRAAVLSASRQLDVVSVPVSANAQSGGWVDVEACGICGSDWSWYAERPINDPFVPGHEIIGTIGELWGEMPLGLRVGDRVALEEALPCQNCAACRAGRHRLCATSTRYGATSLATAPGLWGGFAERVYLSPRANVHRVPASLDRHVAPLFVPLSNGLSWLTSAGDLRPGDTVAVLGVGQHGLACVAAARRCGAGVIVATGRAGDAARLDAAKDLGADITVDVESVDLAAVLRECTSGDGVDVTVDTTPAATDVLAQAAASAAIGGRIVIAGLKSGRTSPVSTDLLVRRELSVRGVAARESWAIDSALHWLTEDPDAFAGFGSRVVGLDDVEQTLLGVGGQLPGERTVHAVVLPT